MFSTWVLLKKYDPICPKVSILKIEYGPIIVTFIECNKINVGRINPDLLELEGHNMNLHNW